MIQGRLFDVQGRPVRGVAVSVESMGTIVTGSPDMTIGETEGPYFLRDQPNDLPAWPRPATTDADGRFTIRGAGRDLRVGLVIDDPRFARQKVLSIPMDPRTIKNVTMAVEPARIITGRVTYADTGKPAPHALVDLDIQGDDGSSAWAGDFETDAQGRFRANPGSAHRYLVIAFPPEREPYLNVSTRFEWPKGAIEHPVDLALPRGVLVRGKVTEEGSGKPIAGARIGYISNPDRDPQSGASNSRAATAVGWLVPARGHARSGLSHRPGARRGLRAPGDRPAHGPRGSAGRAPVVCPRLPRPGPEAGQREPGRRHHAPAQRRRAGPGRRTGRPARPRTP